MTVGRKRSLAVIGSRWNPPSITIARKGKCRALFSCTREEHYRMALFHQLDYIQRPFIITTWAQIESASCKSGPA